MERSDFFSRHRFWMIVAISVLSTAGREIGWRMTPSHNFQNFAWPAKLSIGLNLPAAVTSTFLADVSPVGGWLYQYIDHFCFFVAVIALWIWLPIWVKQLFAARPFEGVFVWLSLGFSLGIGFQLLLVSRPTLQRQSTFLATMATVWAVVLIGFAAYAAVRLGRTRK